MRRAILSYAVNQYTGMQIILFSIFLGYLDNIYAHTGTNNVALGYKLLRHLHSLIDRYGKAEALGAYGVAVLIIAGKYVLRSSYTYYLALHIEQRAAAVAGVDGCVGLQIFVLAAVNVYVPRCCTDYAECGRARQLTAGGISYGDSEIAHPYIFGTAKCQWLQAVLPDIEHSDIHGGIVAYHLGVYLLLVVVR